MTFTKHVWRTNLRATLESVEEFCSAFQLWRAHICPALDRFKSELVLREALTNSVVHGSGGDSRKWVTCVLRAKPGQLLISIRDDGEGFDWRAAWNRTAANDDTSGRGMEILRTYASAVRFSTKGNSVTLLRRYEQE